MFSIVSFIDTFIVFVSGMDVSGNKSIPFYTVASGGISEIACLLSKCAVTCSQYGTCEQGVCVCQEGCMLGTLCMMSFVVYGIDCSSSRCMNDCGGHGVCNYTTNTCMCTPGYTGPDCTVVDHCPGACGHGQCVSMRCVCDAGWYGMDCSVPYCTGSVEYVNMTGTIKTNQLGPFNGRMTCKISISPDLKNSVVHMSISQWDLDDWINVYVASTSSSYDYDVSVDVIGSHTPLVFNTTYGSVEIVVNGLAPVNRLGFVATYKVLHGTTGTINYISQRHALITGGTHVFVSGDDIFAGQDSASTMTVSLGDIPATVVEIDHFGKVIEVITHETHATGTGDVVVCSGALNYCSTLSNAFTYVAPINLLYCEPDSIVIRSNVTVR